MTSETSRTAAREPRCRWRQFSLRRFLILTVDLFLLAASGCQPQSERPVQMADRLATATALGGQLDTLSGSVQLSPEQAAKALDLLRYIYSVRSARNATSMPGGEPPVGLYLELAQPDGTQFRTSLTYYGRAVGLPDGCIISQAADEAAIVRFVDEMTSEQKSAAAQQ